VAGPPEVLGRTRLWTGKRAAAERMDVRLADGVEIAKEVIVRGDAASVLPYDAERRCALLVRLFRAPVRAVTDRLALEEACAGMLDPGESPEAAMRREAMEEMGVRLETLEPVATIWPTPGILTERLSLFLAPYGPADRVADGGGAPGEHEGITVVERPLAELAADADAGRLLDGKLFALVQTLRLKRPDLFNSPLFPAKAGATAPRP
jgi:nudix-type nucleoside diphosphatase (YffH/AdpP family)